MSIAASELVINEDGTIYHLGLHPDQLYPTVITVGDPGRVERLSRRFDRVDYRIQKREFVTHGGKLENKDIMVISTGIGTDNVDIVLNEIDALANIDFTTQMIKENHTSLDIMRVGTSGTILPHIEVDSIILSKGSIGLDGLMHFYQREKLKEEIELLTWDIRWPIPPYFNYGSPILFEKYKNIGIPGITVSNTGFYGPQGRTLRLNPTEKNLFDQLSGKSIGGSPITNLEMETSGLYGLCELLGHHCLSVNVILANRPNGKFSRDPYQSVEKMIDVVFEAITQDA